MCDYNTQLPQAMTRSFDPRKISAFIGGLRTHDEIRPYEQVHLRHSYVESLGYCVVWAHYIGHNYTGYDHVGHNYIGHSYICTYVPLNPHRVCSHMQHAPFLMHASAHA